MTKFAEFFRNASPEEKAEVYQVVMEEAILQQLEIINLSDRLAIAEAKNEMD